MENLLVSGIVLSSDKYGRVRLFIDDSYEITKIIDYIKQNNYAKFPFENGKIDKSGSVLIITLKKHKDFWIKKIEENRSKKINIEVSARTWVMSGKSGISLDLISIIE